MINDLIVCSPRLNSNNLNPVDNMNEDNQTKDRLKEVLNDKTDSVESLMDEQTDQNEDVTKDKDHKTDDQISCQEETVEIEKDELNDQKDKNLKEEVK